MKKSGISQICSKMSKFAENAEKTAKFCENSVQNPFTDAIIHPLFIHYSFGSLILTSMFGLFEEGRALLRIYIESEFRERSLDEAAGKLSV